MKLILTREVAGLGHPVHVVRLDRIEVVLAVARGLLARSAEALGHARGGGIC